MIGRQWGANPDEGPQTEIYRPHWRIANWHVTIMSDLHGSRGSVLCANALTHWVEYLMASDTERVACQLLCNVFQSCSAEKVSRCTYQLAETLVRDISMFTWVSMVVARKGCLIESSVAREP